MKLSIVALILAGFVTGCGASVETTKEAPAATVAIEEPSAREQMVDWWQDNRENWHLMQQRMSAVDLTGAVNAMNRIDPMPDRGAQRLWMQWQRDLNTAKTAYDMGDIVTATRYVEKAIPHMTALTKYIEGLA